MPVSAGYAFSGALKANDFGMIVFVLANESIRACDPRDLQRTMQYTFCSGNCTISRYVIQPLQPSYFDIEAIAPAFVCCSQKEGRT